MIKFDFEVVVEVVWKNFVDVIGVFKILNVIWDDVGGLNNVKEVVMEMI